MTPVSCPDPAQLQELVNGTLTLEDEAHLIAHLDSCPSCRQKLETLAGDEFPLRKPTADENKPSPAEGPALAAVVAQLQEQSGVAGASMEAAGSGPPNLSFLSPSMQPGHLGRLGHYEVLSVVGRGGMGVVLKARDDTLNRIVAIKVMAPQLATSGTARQRFIREARAAAAVRDEHVINIHAVEEENGLPYMVMEYINGTTLQERLNRKGPVELSEVLRIGMQVAKGLAAAHAQGLVHRDIKPANILLENGVERVKISDFGLARAADDASLTQSGVVAGTPEYMSPEQADGEAVDHRTDLFSLGSVLYAMCAGRPPFRARGALAVLKRICEDTPRPLREINPDLPEWLWELIVKLHAKKPADRFSSAAEVAHFLGRGLSGIRLGIPYPTEEGSRPSTSPPTAPQPKGRRRWLVVAVAALLLAAALGLTEAAGVTNIRGTVIRLFSSDGTLVVEVDDPAVSVSIDGTDLVITGAGTREIRLKPGEYKVEASKDGKVVRQELVEVTREGRRIVRISKEVEPLTEAERWARTVAEMPAEKQVEAVTQRLRHLNPHFNGEVTPEIANGVVTKLEFLTDQVDDISPLRAFKGLVSLQCEGTYPRRGLLSDLTPLRGMRLKALLIDNTLVADLRPLRGMPLTTLICGETRVADLSPLKGMKLEALTLQRTKVTDLSPLRGMPLAALDLFESEGISDLKPLQGMPLRSLNLGGLRVSDLSLLADMKSLQDLYLESMPVTDLTPLRSLALNGLDIRGTRAKNLTPIEKLPLKWLRLDYHPDREAFLRSFPHLESINEKPAAEFWKEVSGK